MPPKPRPSQMRTTNLPNLTTDPGAQAIRIATSDELATRVLAQALGVGGRVRVGYDAQDLLTSNAIGAAGFVWEMTASETQVFVLAPKQELYAIGVGGSMKVAVATSDALPMSK